MYVSCICQYSEQYLHLCFFSRPKVNVNEENVGTNADEMEEHVGESSCNNHSKQPKIDAYTVMEK